MVCFLVDGKTNRTTGGHQRQLWVGRNFLGAFRRPKLYDVSVQRKRPHDYIAIAPAACEITRTDIPQIKNKAWGDTRSSWHAFSFIVWVLWLHSLWIRTRDEADFSVVCGDFNAAPDQPSIQLMSAACRPTQPQATAFTPLREPGGDPTHPEWERFNRCIDYIWVSDSIKVWVSGLCFDQPDKNNPELWPSDHVGVWADLEIG